MRFWKSNMYSSFYKVLLISLSGLSSFAQKITFYQDIQPIFHANCAGCHRPGEAAPFNLITYEDISKRSDFIKKVITSGYMPPWRANDNYTHFANKRQLSDSQIQTIVAWIDTDMPKGKINLDAEKKLLDRTDAGTAYHRKPDLTLKMDKAYLQKGDGEERFMVFKIPFELPTEANVEAVEFVSNNKKIIHHANYAIHPVEDPTIDLHNTVSQINLGTDEKYTYDQWLPYKKKMVYYGGWIPGSSYESYPAGVGWKMPRRGVILLTIHFGPSGKDAESFNGVNFFFKTEPIKRTVKVISLGSGGIGQKDIDPPLMIFANDKSTHHLQVTNRNEDISLLYIWPHMHQIGAEFKAYAMNLSRDTIPLVHIPNWDFRWQELYRYQQPVILKRGTVIHIDGTYDNTAENPANPFKPPKLVLSNGDMRSDQEMLTLLLVYVPYEEGDENKTWE
jgi:hypothetical protein